MAILASLQKHGWYLNQSVFEEHFPGKDNADDIIKSALDLDLRQIGEPHVPESTWKTKTETVEGPLVLQLQKLRNVCVPREGDGSVSSGGSQLLRLTLTDGQHSICALDMDNVSGLGINTPPGTKLKLIGKATVCNGHLLLFRKNCKLLGGHVQNLVDTWNLKRSLAAHSRESGRSAGGDGGPPPFIPFGQRGKQETPIKNVNFKSLDIGGKKKEADSEFEQQRRATIEAALQQQQQQQSGKATTKQLQCDRDLAAIVDMGFTAEQATAALQQASGNFEAALNLLLSTPDVISALKPSMTNGRAPMAGDGRPMAAGYRNSDGPPRHFEKSTTNYSNHRMESSRGDRDRPDRERSDRPDRERTDRPDRDRPDRERSDRDRDASGRRGGRRGGGRVGDDDDTYGNSRPSTAVTLFDFVTTKMAQTSISSAGAGTETVETPVAAASSLSTSSTTEQPPRSSSNSSATAASGRNPREGGGRDAGPREGGGRNGGTGRDAGPREGGGRDGDNRDAGSRESGGRDGGGREGRDRDAGTREGSSMEGGPMRDGGGRENSGGCQLPPRLQRKQQQAEEEKYMKYYKPMDYMRQSTYQHSSEKPSARRGPPRGNGGGGESRPNENVAPRHSSTDAEQRVHDIHSRGNVRNRKLWKDEPTATENDRGSSHEAAEYGKPRPDAGNSANFAGVVENAAGIIVCTAAAALTSAPNPRLSQSSQQYVPGANDRRWNIGEKCLAKYWQDGKMYKAQITAIAGGGGSQRSPRFTVLFTEYGNTEVVNYSDLSELNEPTWEMGGVYSTQDNSGQCMVAPVTLAHGANIVYHPQPNVQTTMTAMAPEPPTFYFTPQPYLQMPPTNVYDNTHAVHVAPRPATANCPVPGILVQGPPPAMYHHQGAPPTTCFQPAIDAGGMENVRTRNMRAQPQLYVPPPQRK